MPSPTSATHDPPASLDTALVAMREATERLAGALEADADPEVLDVAWGERRIAFERVVERVRAGERPGQRGADELARLRALDARLMDDVPRRLEADRSAQRALRRRRGALAAHSRRERLEPRALTVKA